MPSFNYYLKDVTCTEETPIYLRYNERGVNMKFFIGKKIHPKDWNPKDQQVKRSLSGYAVLNSLLAKRKSQLQTLHSQLQATDETVSRNKMRARFNQILERVSIDKKPQRSKYLTDFVEGYIKSVSATLAPNTIRHLQESLKLLRCYELHNINKIIYGTGVGSKRKKISKFKKISFTDSDSEQYVLTGLGQKYKTLTFDDIDLNFHRKFIGFMQRAKYATNWIGKIIKNIKLFMAEAGDEKLHQNSSYAHRKFTAMQVDVDSIYLNEEELSLIHNYDFSANCKLNNARDLFIIGCWTGLRYSDLSQLTQFSISKNRIISVTIKTGATVVIPIHAHVYEVLDRYSDTENGLPYNISSAKLNKYIKEIGEIVGLNESVTLRKKIGRKMEEITRPKYNLITTHIMRRSFATNLYKQKIPAISIMMITGHKTETAFMKYIKVGKEENASRIESSWQQIEKISEERNFALSESNNS